jgi:signal transduction histidine kinase/DNA-binding response OmpR family regulator
MLLICNNLFAQKRTSSIEQTRIDSLLKIRTAIKERGADIKQLAAIDSDLAHRYFSLFEFQLAVDYSQQAIKLYEQLEDKKAVAAMCDNISQTYWLQGQYDKALEFDLKTLKYYEEAGDMQHAANATRHIGKVYYDGLNDHQKALEYYQKSLELSEKCGDTAGVIKVDDLLGLFYLQQGDCQKSLGYYQEVLKYFERKGDKAEIKDSYLEIGNVYALCIKDCPKALSYYRNGLRLSDELGSKEGVSVFLLCIGAMYYYLEDYAQANNYYESVIRVAEENGVNSRLLEVLDEHGNLYVHVAAGNAGHPAAKANAYLTADDERLLRKYVPGKPLPTNKALLVHDAINDFQRGIALAKELNLKKWVMTYYNDLRGVYTVSGNYEKALEYTNKYYSLKDSLFSAENEKKLTGIQMQYSFGKKADSLEAESAKKEIIANKEVRNQKNIRNSLLGGLLLVLIFAGFVFRSLSISRKQKIAIEEQKNRAERSEAFNKQFLANMSHEIRTPMNAVMGMTNLVLDTPLGDKQRAYLEGIKHSSDNLLHIINDILDISKIEAGKMELEQIDFSLSDHVAQVKQTLLHRAEEKGLQLIANIDDNIPDVLIGDPVRLNQVLINLTGNAIKFTEKGSVTIEVKKVNEGIKFSIIDTGIGIPKDKLQTVFENFSQANASDTRKYGGTGLGLSISRQLVGMMGGNIDIESEEGSGTTFSFTLHFEKGSAERLQQRLAAEQQVDGSILDGLNILVVDDNEYNRIVTKDTLESKSKANVTAVNSAKEAISLLKEKQFDVVLMDAQMPEMNGFEATRYIRDNFEAPVKNIPIIALTASVLRTDLDKCRKAGMDSYIPKPFKATQLITGIAQVLHIALKAEKKKENVSPTNIAARATDLTYLRKFCENDEERMQNYIRIYLKAAAEFGNKVRELLDAKDFEGIAALVHSFKPKWMMMGMKPSMELGQKTETLCTEAGDQKRIAELMGMLIEQTRTSLEELSA